MRYIQEDIIPRVSSVLICIIGVELFIALSAYSKPLHNLMDLQERCIDEFSSLSNSFIYAFVLDVVFSLLPHGL